VSVKDDVAARRHVVNSLCFAWPARHLLRAPFRGAAVKRGRVLAGVHSLSEPVLIVFLGLVSAKQGVAPEMTARPALSIQGAPAAVARPDTFYAFTPTVFRRNARVLQFSVENKPAWLSFGSRRGTLYGTPHAIHAGMYSNIVITVSDGLTTVRLPAFSIEVPASRTP